MTVVARKFASSQFTLTTEKVLALPCKPQSRATAPRDPSYYSQIANIFDGVGPKEVNARLNKNIIANGFPYTRYVVQDGRAQTIERAVLRVENERWQMDVLPSMAGRIMNLYDKKLGRELLWQPPVLRYASIGLAGAWSQGGIEFNPFRYGHQVFGHNNLRIEQVKLASGWEGLRTGAVDELFGCSWEAIIVLLEDRLAMRFALRNHSDRPQPGYWWTNIASPMTNDTRVMYCPGPMIHHGMFRVGFEEHQWPMLHGRDWSYWQNHHEIISGYLYDNGSDYFGYCDNADGVAMVHHADRRDCKGRKLWSLGSQYDAVVWWDRVGELDLSSYCELQSGRCATQVEADLIPPGATVEWTESVTGAPLELNGSDAVSTFKEFERAGATALSANAAAVQDAANWRVISARTIVEPDERVVISEKIVLSPQSLSDKEIERTCATGWVGGHQWIKLLSDRRAQKKTTPAMNLALGAALLDEKQLEEASGILNEVASGDGTPAAWANYLLGLKQMREGNRAAAAEVLSKALGADAPLYLASLLHRALVDLGRVEEAQQMWGKLPVEIRQQDEARVAQAEIAFRQRRWNDARKLLQEPLWVGAEGDIFPYLLRKETDLAEAFELCGKGQWAEAQALLSTTPAVMNQFGIGRDEANANGDLLYYRWMMAQRCGDQTTASALSSHLLRKVLYPGLADAAYQWRLAAEMGHPSAPRRLRRLLDWQAGKESHLQTWVPLRMVLVEAGKGNPQAWKSLENHMLLRYRASFEMEQASR